MTTGHPARFAVVAPVVPAGRTGRVHAVLPSAEITGAGLGHVAPATGKPAFSSAGGGYPE